mgnify:CR=1 FL=1
MTLLESIDLMQRYAKCPKCGCEVVGNGKGAVKCDTEKGYFKRTCSCGWCVEVTDNYQKISFKR